MLTADLVRARVRRGRVHPSYVPARGEAAAPYLARAEALIEVFAAGVGRRRGELDAAVEELVAGRPDFKLDRGLRKLLEDRSELVGLDPAEAARRRGLVFARAAARRVEGRFDREAVLAEAAAEAGVAVAELEGGLYGDLKENEVLVATKPITPERLLDRYNLALAQAVLLRAESLSITVEAADPPRLRQLLRHAKFHGLLQSARRDGEVVRLELDGPLSIFQATPRYGVKMAGFLPALLLCERWELEARVQHGRSRSRRTFRLTHEEGLRTHVRDAGAWLPELVEAFAARFPEVAPDWDVDTQVPPLNLGGELVVPDFRFVHRESGWEGWLEVLGYWRKGGVERRLDALAAEGAPRLVLALERSLKVDEEKVGQLAGPVVFYREIPDARKVRKRLEELRAGA